MYMFKRYDFFSSEFLYSDIQTDRQKVTLKSPSCISTGELKNPIVKIRATPPPPEMIYGRPLNSIFTSHIHGTGVCYQLQSREIGR